MSEVLRVFAILLRFGWRAALSAFVRVRQGTFSKIFACLFLPYLIFMNYWTNLRIFWKLADPGHVYELLTDWTILPCATASCTKLMESSSAWPAVPQLLWLGILVMLPVMVIGILSFQLLTGHGDKLNRSEEWLRTFPVPLRTLLWAQLLQSSLVHPFFLFFVIPFHLSLAWVSGFDLWTIAYALIVSSTLMGVAMSMSFSFNYFMAYRLPRAWAFRIRWFGFGPLMGLTVFAYFGFLGESRDYWESVLRMGPFLESSSFAQMTTLFLGPKVQGVFPLMALILCGLLFAHGNLTLAARFSTQKPLARSTEPARSKDWIRGRLDGLSPIVRRDMLTVLRNPARLIMPLIFPALILFMGRRDHSFADPASSGEMPLTFCLTYVLMLGIMRSAQQLLADKQSIGLYTAIPRRLSEIQAESKRFYLRLSLCLFGLLILIFMPWSAFHDPILLIRLGFALLSIVLLETFISTQLLLALHSDSQNKKRDDAMGVVAFAGPVTGVLIGFGSWETILSVIIFSTAGIFTLRQKILRHEDQLLDPDYEVPRESDLTNGLFSALIFLLGLKTFSSDMIRYLTGPGERASFILALWAAGFLAGWHVLAARADQSDLPLFVKKAGRLQPFILLLLAGALTLGGLQWMSAATLLLISTRTITEEFIFRGLIQRGLSVKLGSILAIVVAAGCSMLTHDVTDMLPSFLIALASGVLYHRTRVLWPGMALTVLLQILLRHGF